MHGIGLSIKYVSMHVCIHLHDVCVYGMYAGMHASSSCIYTHVVSGFLYLCGTCKRHFLQGTFSADRQTDRQTWRQRDGETERHGETEGRRDGETEKMEREYSWVHACMHVCMMAQSM
jgi:hypothetical protein